MKPSIVGTTRPKAFGWLLAWALSLVLSSVLSMSAAYAAASLSVNPTTVSVTCNTATGPGTPAPIAVKLSGSSASSIIVGTGSFSPLAASSPILVAAPASVTFAANSIATLNFSVNAQANCLNSTPGQSSATFHFTGSGGLTDVVITVNLTVVAGPSPLVASPSALTITCTLAGSTYTEGQPQAVSITSPVAGGTVFTVDQNPLVSTALPWAKLSGPFGGTAAAAPVTFSVVAFPDCNSFGAGTTRTGTIHLRTGLLQDKVINVTFMIVAASPLFVSPAPASFTYIKGSGEPGYADVSVLTSLTKIYFSVDTSSLPPYLTVDAAAGTTPRSLRFSTTSIAESMPPGLYKPTVRLQVFGYGDLPVSINVTVSNPPAQLSVVEGLTRALSWTIGQPLWTPYITLKSSDTPIPYTIRLGTAFGDSLNPQINSKLLNGLAYNFGSAIPVTFLPADFAGVAAGAVLTGTVWIQWGNNPSVVSQVVFNITVQAPGATLTAISPKTVPTSPAGTTVQIGLIGTGFVASMDQAVKTRVGIVVNNALIANPNFSANVVNPSNIILSITVPAVADPLLPFAPGGSGGPVTLGVCNPINGSCTGPTGAYTLQIGAGPIVQAVTSAASFIEIDSPPPPVAPYDMISIFGTNFCSNCIGPNAILSASPNNATLTYPTSLTNTDSLGVSRSLKVTFKTHAATAAPLTVAGPTLTNPVDAPLLFATNNQINLLVPQAVALALNQSSPPPNTLVDIAVSYGTAGAMASSAPFPVTVVAANPGVFTIGADGIGDGAILDAVSAVVVDAFNPGGMRQTLSSDIVSIYMTGLGEPNSAASNLSSGSSGGPQWPGDCIDSASYLASLAGLTGTSLPSIDGTVIQSSLLNSNRLAPCLDQRIKPTVRIGGVQVIVGYAGWVADSIAGLYQINVTLPTPVGTFYPNYPDLSGPLIDITRAMPLPVTVTASGGATSQANVMIWVQPKLSVSPPDTLTAHSGDTWTGNVVVADGSGTYTYTYNAYTWGSGLVVDQSTGALSGTAGSLGTYPVTVDVYDTLNIGLRGSASFVLTIN